MRRCLFANLIVMPFLLAMSSSHVLAWGEEGHAVVAEIAQRRLSPAAADAITAILKANVLKSEKAPSYAVPSLASISTWADEVRYDANGKPNGTYNWHFVDIPRLDPKYDPATECPKEYPERGDCVIAELGRLRNELRCSTGQKQLEALKYAVHFVGDIHQPFHTIWESVGGNSIHIKLQFKGKTCTNDTCTTPPDNLHKVWDTTLIRAMEWNWGTLVDDIESGFMTSDTAKNDHENNPVEWAQQAHQAAIDRNIWVDDGATLDQAYYDRATPLVTQQLGLAGIRLARYLNEAFSSNRCPYP